MDIKQSLEELRRQEQQQIAKIQDAVTSLSTPPLPAVGGTSGAV